MKIKWNADRVARAVMHVLLDRSAVVCPNSYFTGYEADLLCVDAKSLRLIDIEVKVDRADLKADYAKGKWRHSRWIDGKRVDLIRDHPQNIWKHYYAMPNEVWRDDLSDMIPSSSGIILIRNFAYNKGSTLLELKRRAKPNRAAKPITPEQVFDIARLVNLRYWDRVNRVTARRIGKVIVARYLLQDVITGQGNPDPGLLEAMKNCLVLSVDHDVVNDTIVYTCHNPVFRETVAGDVIPSYYIEVESGIPRFVEKANETRQLDVSVPPNIDRSIRV